MTLLTAILLLAAGIPISTHEPMEPRGELEIYHAMTENGTVARRQLRDAHGLVTETAYYGLKPRENISIGQVVRYDFSDVTEDRLQLTRVTHMRYDGRRLILEENFSGCELESTHHTEYDPSTGQKSRELTVWSRGRRSQTIEAVREGRSPTTYFCATDGDISYVTGPVPADLPTAGGIRTLGRRSRSSHPPSAEEGPAEGLFLTLTVRNVGAASAEAPNQPYLPVEIRDAEGTDRPDASLDARHLRCSSRGRADESRRECRGSSLEPGHAAWVTHYDVDENWGPLPPGNYRAVAKSCLPGRGEDAVTSNIANFTITAP